MVYSAIPLGSGLMCFRFLQVLVAFIRTGELPTTTMATSMVWRKTKRRTPHKTSIP